MSGGSVLSVIVDSEHIPIESMRQARQMWDSALIKTSPRRFILTILDGVLADFFISSSDSDAFWLATQVPTKEEKHDFRVKEKNDWATLKSIFFPLPTSYESFGGEKKELKPGVIKPTRSDFFILSSVMLYHYLILTIVN